MDHLADSTAKLRQCGKNRDVGPLISSLRTTSVDFDVCKRYLSLPKKNLTIIRRI